MIVHNETINITTEALQLIQADEAFQYKLLPARIESESVLICLGIEDTDYTKAKEEIELIYGYQIEVVSVAEREFMRSFGIHYRSIKKGQDAVEQVRVDEKDHVSRIIEEAVRVRASDIHIEPSEERCKVRMRIDGRLLERQVISKEVYPGLVNRIKIMSNMDISEKRLPQDGRIMYKRKEVKFDIRTSIMPTVFGEKIVMRLLIKDEKRMSLEELGMDKNQYEYYVNAISKPHGLILISGPTGSGKSTTLYATLERLNTGDNNILTIEDPVEYTLDGINQVQLKEEIGLSFGVALRTFLRQDPDIIMLGEIRDEDTAEMAIRSSLTGHLLLSTLHTNSAWGCITRLADMGIHPYLISETLIACVAQRLVRLLCPHCKERTEVAPICLESAGISEDILSYRKCGCPECYYTGYKGRKAIYEVLLIDSFLSEAIKRNNMNVAEYFSRKQIKTLKDSALSLYKNGETSIEEIYPILNESCHE